MRLLNLIGIQKFIVGHDPESSYVLLVNAREVDQFQDDEVLLTNACFICLSNNRLATDSITTLWKKFPSAWWVDLSNNQLHSLDGQYPRALGSLNVSGNALQLATLSNLVHTHILRLHVSTSPELSITSYSTINSMIASILPNVWVINDDFISSFDRREGAGRSDNHLPGEVNSDIVIPSNNLGDRENKLIRAIQNCPTKGKYSDYFRLEILLEEYLQEACYFNCFAQQIALQNNSSHRHINNMPFVDVYALIMLPHRLRLDLTVVLTTSVMFPVPKSLLRDALLITGAQYLCSEDIDQLYQLPAFAKTALVCLLRRVSKKELLEWSTIQQFCPKPYRHMPLAQQKHMYTENAPPALDYLDSRGFQFLRPVKEYLEQAIEVTVTDPAQLHAMVPFSELEIEIISKLPDAPTLSSAAVYFKEKAAEQASGKANNASASYKEWIPFAARHTVLLLTKAPSCPPLTRPQQSKVKQELYFEMLPILRAANMTMNDLDLAFVGPGRDGRMLNAKTATLGPTVKPTSMDAPTAPGGAKIGGSFGKDALNMGANALPFGTGLPRAAPGSVLSWKVQEVPRNYAKAWNMEESRRKTGEQEEQEEEGTAQFTDDLESLPVTAKGGNVFLTSSEAQQLEATTSASLSASPPPPLKVKSYGEFSISQFDFGAPAPLPRNRSFSTGQSPSKLALPASGSNNEEEIEYLMGHLRSPPPRSLSNSQSDHLYRAGGNHESTGHLSASIVVPITNPASPDGSLFSHSTGAGAGDIGMNLDGGQSRYSEGPAASETLSVAESEPFRMLTGAAEEGASPEHTISHTPHHRPPSQQGYSQQVTAQNRHSATAASATTMATRPEYVSGALAKPILGFSADANWSSKFLLASPSAVAQANFTVGRADPANTWNFIEYAPVLVHTPAARLSRETLRELSASVACRTAAGDGVTRSVVNGMSDTSQERQAGHAAHGLVLTDSLESRSKIPPGGAKDTAEDALEAHQVDPDADSNAEAGAADPSVHTEESSFNYRAPSEAGDLVGGNVNINFNVNVNNFAVDVVPSGRSAHQHYMPTVEYKARRSEDPVVTLMKEMGTVRNVRFLREQNERIAALSRSSAKARTNGFEEDVSVALSQSQLSQTSFGFGEQPSQWELDPTHPTESTFQQQQQQSPYQHQHQHNGAFDSVAQDNVFLTGVSGAEAEEGEEEEKRDGENGEGEKAQCRAGDINLTGAGRQWRLLNPVDRYEEAGKSYNSDDMLFYTDTDTPSAHTSRPITPHENNALPPRHFSETEGNVLSSNSRRDPHGAGGISSSSSTVRLIPVPEHVKDPPLKALLQSVSTLDIMKSKAQYSNIAVCSRSVEYGNQGINANVGTSWYPLMQKNVYRLSNDALNPDKLFVGATVSKNAGKAVTATRRHKNRTLKPLRSTAAMSSSLPAARMQALLHGAVVNEHPFPTDAEPSEHDGHIQSGGRVAKDVVELTPDLSNSAYFKSLFKAVDRKKSKSAPRPLPALPQKIGASAVNTSEKSSYFYEQYLPRAEDTSSKMHSPGEAHALEGNFSTADFQASYTEPLLEELKETIHCMLLPHNMTPRGSGGDGGGGGGRDSAPLTPPPTEHGLPLNPPTRPTTTTAGPVSHFFVMSDDTAPSSPREAPPTTMSVAGKKLLKSICSPTHSHSQISLAEDDMSSMASVGSALTQHSAVSRHRVVGKDIIRAYNDNISKTNWDEYTDSSSFRGGGTPKLSIGGTSRRNTADHSTATGSAERGFSHILSGSSQHYHHQQQQPTRGTGSSGSAGVATSRVPSAGETLNLAPTVTATGPRNTVVGKQAKMPSSGRQPRHTIAGV